MKKYIVTHNHPIYKAGIEIRENDKNTFDIYYYGKDKYIVISSNVIYDWFIDGWIKELQKPEFTYDDVVAILNKYNNDYVIETNVCNWDNIISGFRKTFKL